MTDNELKIKKIKYNFTVCKVPNLSSVDFSKKFTFLSKTDEEISLVCPTEKVPSETISREDDYKAFRIEGILDFSLIGILSKISTILATNKISIFAVSTFNTDYIFVKKENFKKALLLLSKNGFEIE